MNLEEFDILASYIVSETYRVLPVNGFCARLRGWPEGYPHMSKQNVFWTIGYIIYRASIHSFHSLFARCCLFCDSNAGTENLQKRSMGWHGELGRREGQLFKLFRM